MNGSNPKALESSWGHWPLCLYIAGLLFPFVVFELEEAFPDLTRPFWRISLGILVLCPLSSAVGVAFSNLAVGRAVLWTLLIPVFLFCLLLLYWIGGTVFLGRPFLPVN